MKYTEKINRFILIFILVLFLLLAFFPIFSITLRTYHFPNCYTDKIQEFRLGLISPGHIEKYKGDCEEFFDTFYYKEHDFSSLLEKIGYGRTKINPGFIFVYIVLLLSLWLIWAKIFNRKFFHIFISVFALISLLLIFLFLPKVLFDWRNFFSRQELQNQCSHTGLECPLLPVMACDDHMYKYGINVTMEAESYKLEKQEYCSKLSEKNTIIVPLGCKITDCTIISFSSQQERSELGCGFYLLITTAIIALIYGLINLTFLKPWNRKSS